jgi:hypothetical protein
MNINSLWRRGRRLRFGGDRYSAGRRPGQALVELSLSITFIALLLGAAIDLGLAYKTYQTLMNATAEASSFLSLNPKVNCDSHPTWCTGTDEIGGADREARNRFREEQGTTINGTASTLDLDDNNVDDVGEHGWTWIGDRIDIVEARADEVTMGAGGFYGVPTGFAGTEFEECEDRPRFTADDSLQCFIVVQTEIVYRPYISSRLLGTQMTIRATSVKPIVGGP